MRVLIVEDERRVADNIAAALREGAGYAVDVAEDGEQGLDFASQGIYDLVLLDLMVPRLGGLEVLGRLRKMRLPVPVLVLTARGEKDSVVALLNAGADDYMAKPFDLGELLARSKALIRRGKGLSNPEITLGHLAVNTVEKTVQLHGAPVGLSGTEYRLLECLAHRPRTIVSKRALLEHLYDYNWERHSNVIEVHMSNLRRKLSAHGVSAGESYIETVRGRGYRLIAPPSRRLPGTSESIL